jgi:hypothetical protein
VFARLLDHTTHHLGCSGTLCRPWEAQGGELRGGLLAASGGTNHQLVLGSSFDDALWWRTDDALTGWSKAWTATPVTDVVGGAAVVSIDPATAEVWFRRGPTLWRAQWRASSGWLAATDTGVYATSDPCAVLLRDGTGRVQVLARGTEAQGFGLVRLTLAPSAPVTPPTFTVDPTPIASAPACATGDASRVDLFVRGGRSTLLHATLRAGQPIAFEDLGPITSKPSAASWGPGRLDVVARGLRGEIEHWWLQE